MNISRFSIVILIRRWCSWWISFIILAPALCLVSFVAKDPFCSLVLDGGFTYIFSGALFSQPFNIIHAGYSMDQPTIGKWLIWFAILTFLAVPTLLLARLVNDRSSMVRYWAFAAPVLIFTILLLSILTPPVCLLVQYIFWMGFTPMRITGLAGSAAGFVGLIVFCWWNLRHPKSIRPQKNTEAL